MTYVKCHNIAVYIIASGLRNIEANFGDIIKSRSGINEDWGK